jgi:hypothetical protein
MKKVYTLIIFSLCAYQLSAQLVTITAAHQMPVIGDSIHYVDANTFGFDPVGNGAVTAKIWDFSALLDAGTTYDFMFVDPSTIPSALGRDSFPSANIARGESGTGGYFYYENTASDINRIGWYASSTNYGIYKGGTVATEFHFPITAGDIFNTAYHGRFAPFNVGEDSVVIESGTLTINADMQGLMILPTGSFDSVLRLHVTESFHIKAYILGTPATDNVISDDYYYWFNENYLQPLLTYGITTQDGTPQTPVLRYQPIIVTGINSNSIESVMVYPNPTSGIIRVNLPDMSGHASLEIFDVLGNMVYEKSVNNTENIIDLSAVANGIYYLKIFTDSFVKTEKLVLK